MSAKPRVFEGPDPERLLLEAWSVHGTDVRISEPTAVRRGGVFGFFSKLHYRIEVLEAPVPPPVAEGAALPAPADTVAVSAARPGGAAGALDALIAETEDVVEIGEREPADFDAILAKVVSALGEDPADSLARLAPSVAAPEESAPTRARRSDPPPLARANDAAPTGQARPLPAAEAPGDPVASDAVQIESISLEALHAGPSTPPAAVRTEVPHAAPAPAPRPAATPDLARRLSAAGVPGELAETLALAETLEDACAAFPAPRRLPTTPGSLVAVVGPPLVVRDRAHTIAAELGVAPDEVAFALPRRRRTPAAGHLVVTRPEEAGDLAPGWRRNRIGVVALELAGSGEEAESWGAAMLDALAPSMTLVIAQASEKPEDVAQRCAALGGADALCLEQVGETLTPASALASGVPVATLDGRLADAATWRRAIERALGRRRAE